MDILTLSPEVFLMPKTDPPYSPEVRHQMIDLVPTGRDTHDLTREFEPTAQSVRNWIADGGKKAG